MRRTPLKPKRDRPRRDEGRVKHIRIKPRPGAPPNAEERCHLARVAALPCLACGYWPVTLHHVSGHADRAGRLARSHKLIVPLCNEAPHHQIIYERDAKNPQGVEGLGHRGFYRKYGIDLLAEAERLWRESVESA